MPATFQLPCLTWNTPCCLKRKLNQWPQSNYISRPAGCPCVCFTPVYVSSVGIVSTTRAFCHLPAGLIRVLQSYVALERSSTPQEAASTLQTPHSAVCSVSSTPRWPLKMVWTLFHCFFLLFFFCVFCVCVFSRVKRLGWGQRSMSQSQGCNDISSSLFQSLSKKQRQRVTKTDREEGLHRMSSTSSLSPWLLMPSCRAASLCFITVRRLS